MHFSMVGRGVLNVTVSMIGQRDSPHRRAFRIGWVENAAGHPLLHSSRSYVVGTALNRRTREEQSHERMNKVADPIVAPEQPSPDAVAVHVLEVFDGDYATGHMPT
jgi:hypothetical protein